MAFTRYATAVVTQRDVSQRGWGKVRKAAASPTRNLVSQASEILGKPFSPDDYLLTHCFPAGHRVLMADGTEKPIEEVQEGDLVLTHEGNIKPVTRLLRREVDEDLTVIQSASLPEVSCTGEHPFYVVREQDAWCGVYPSYHGHVKCTFGNKQVCERNTCRTNGAVPEWVDAQDVQEGDRTYTPTLHEIQVPKDLNPNRMRLLGYYTAEGRVDEDKRNGSWTVRFSIHEDEIPTLGTEIVRLMRLEFGIQTHSVIQNHKREERGATLSFSIGEDAAWFLKHAGIGSRTKHLSASVMWAPHDWQREFLGAWLNGDGCNDQDAPTAGSQRGLRLVTTSDDLASQAVVLLDRLGIHSNLQGYDAPGRMYRGRWIAASSGWHISIPRSYVPKLADVVRWDVEGTRSKRVSTKGRYRYVASTLSVVDGVSRRHFSGTVYNLSVKDDESYVVNRQAVHNCTIVASVDVDEVPNVRLGRVKVGSKTINRKYSDYYIKPECNQYVNNNGDSWARNVLLMAYQSFIGSHNFLEHVQIEEQSKGRLIDAVSRDIGDSVYVDILVATDKRHEQLVKDIESGKIATLSMGCTVDETICTKCGNVAVDETELCDCIKYAKLDHFFDESGQRRVIAELCGHESLGDDGGVQFIEASWVASPAFGGAVLRNILEPTAMPASLAKRIQAVLNEPPPEWNASSQQKAASIATRAGWGDEEEGAGEGEGEAAPADEGSPLDTLQDDVYKAIVDRVKKQVKDDLKKEEVGEALNPEDSTMAPNDSVIKEARYRKAAAKAYKGALIALMKTASSDVAFVDSLSMLNQSFGVSVPKEVYRASLKVGAFDQYSSIERFVGACQRALLRPTTPADLRVMIRIGKMLTQMGSSNPPTRR